MNDPELFAGKYELRQLAGRGGMAEVWRAEQRGAADVARAARDRASESGATHALAGVAAKDASAALREITEGGADLILECVGSPDTVALGVNALHPGGRLVVVGVGWQPPRIDLPQAIFGLQELALLGSFGSHRADLERVLQMQERGEIDIDAAITHRLGLEEVSEGFERLRSKRGDPDRIVMALDT